MDEERKASAAGSEIQNREWGPRKLIRMVYVLLCSCLCCASVVVRAVLCVCGFASCDLLVAGASMMQLWFLG